MREPSSSEEDSPDETNGDESSEMNRFDWVGGEEGREEEYEYEYEYEYEGYEYEGVG